MRPLLGHILLALVWVGLTGDFTLGNFAVGLVVGLLVLALLGDLAGARDYVRRVVAALRLGLLFGWELSLAKGRVAYDVVTPRLRARPAVVAVPLEARGDLELLLLSTLVTLTPGTVVIDVADDRAAMYVYGMYAGEPDAFRERIKQRFEARVLALTRSGAEAAPR